MYVLNKASIYKQDCKCYRLAFIMKLKRIIIIWLINKKVSAL